MHSAEIQQWTCIMRETYSVICWYESVEIKFKHAENEMKIKVEEIKSQHQRRQEQMNI